jgi:endonuclease YncB( thermonuclease family)
MVLPVLIPLTATLIAVSSNGGAMAGGMISGPVSHVRDGDTFAIAGIAIRPQGITTPDLKEP